MPRPVADTFATRAGKVLNVPTADVLAYDNDPDDDTPSAVLASELTKGTITLAADGSFSCRAKK